MKNPFLIGETVYLRPLSLEDIDGNYACWLNDPEVNKGNSHHVFPYSRIMLEEYVKSSFVAKDALPLAIIEKGGDVHIGNITLSSIDYINRRTDWGIIIGEKDYWGKGYSKEAAYLLLKHAFESLNMFRVYSGTTEKNIGAQKLMEGLGMIKEGVRRKHIYRNGEYHDIIEYGLLRDEFYRKFDLT